MTSTADRRTSPDNAPARPAREGPPNSTAPRLPYQPALDGIRGLAVAAVLAYHAGLPWARGGFLGVDAFFVLSGYLITSLLLVEWRATGSIDLLAFWTRRARRLLPALFLVFVGVIGYAAVFAEPEELGTLRQDAFATLGYVANWRQIFAGVSYFEQFAAPSPLRHTWSLAIEEQWYLVWPLLLIVLLRVGRRSVRLVGGTALMLAAGSALLMVSLYEPNADPARAYYGTDTRAQALLIGAVLAVLLLRPAPALAARHNRWLQLAAIACAAYVGWMWVTTSGDSLFLYRGGFFLGAIAVAVVIGAAVQPQRGPVAAFLSLRPLRALGLVSYGVYLWHWPVYLVLTPERVGWDGHALFVVRALATLAIAIASYQLIETPFRRGALRAWRATWSVAPAAAAVLAIGLVLSTRSDGPALSVAGSSAPPATSGLSSLLSETTESRPVRVLVVGDSVAFTMGLGLGSAAPEWNLAVWNNARLGCGVLRADAFRAEGRWVEQDGSCNDWPSRWQSYVDVFEPDAAVLLAGAWDLFDRKYQGRVLEFGTAETDAFVLAELHSAVDVLSSRGARVMLLTTPYFDPRDFGVNAGSPRFDRARIDRLNSLYRQLEQQRTGDVLVLDLNALVRDAGTDGTIEMQNDGVHFAPAGAEAVARWLAPQIIAAGRAAGSDAPAGSAVAGPAELPPARWLELLEHVPDTSETRSLTVMNDYARYRAAFQIELPEAADRESLFGYYRRLLFDADGKQSGLAPAEATGASSFPPRLTEAETQLGFTIADIDQDLWTSQDGQPAQLLRGRFDAARVNNALLAESQQRSVAALGDLLYVAASAEGVEAMTGAAAGPRPSLAGDPDVRLLVGALERLDTYTAAMSYDTESYTVAELGRRLAGADADAGGVAAARAGLERETKLVPYLAFATGAALDAGGPYTALILLHADEAAAQRNALLLPKRIAEGTSLLGGQAFREIVRSADIVVEGRLVVAKLRTGDHPLWFGLPAIKDTLLLHE